MDLRAVAETHPGSGGVRVRPLLLGRFFAAGVGLTYAVSAAVTLARIFEGLPALRSFRWPLFAGEAAILVLIALLTIAGATIHIADLAVAGTTMLALMIAKYDSESGLAPAAGVSTALVVFLYARGGLGSIRALATPRRVALVLAGLLAVAALWRMEEPLSRVEWQRIRTPAGGARLSSFRIPGTCATYLPGAKDVDEIDAGCIDVIPAKRAGFVIAFATLSGALAVAGVAGAPRVRRLFDGTAVPTWT
jgi:hypothetical protein